MQIKDLLHPFSNIRESYKEVFESDHGQRVLKHLMQVAYMDTPTYTPGDSHETAHREGMRRVVLSIFSQLRLRTENIKEILEEMHDAEDAFTRGQ